MEQKTEKEANLKLEIRSEEVAEIMEHIPPWIIRWGIAAIFILLMGVLGAAWFIEYPELITSRIVITSQSPPARLVAKVGGNIETMYVKENDVVKKGDLLASIGTSTHVEDVLRIKKQLEAFNLIFENPDKFKPIQFEKHVLLGELQPYYSAFIEKYSNYLFNEKTSYYNDKIQYIRDQMKHHQYLEENFKKQQSLLSEELALTEKKYKNDKYLVEKKVISESAFDASSSAYLQKKYAVESILQASINNDIKISEYNKLLLDLTQQHQEGEISRLLAIQESYKQLISQILGFEQRYLFFAPIDGKISTHTYWTKNQFINAGEELLAVVPGYSEIFGKAVLPEMGSGKVKVQQKVKIKIDDYDFKQYGIVEGRISSISLTAKDNLYYVNVSLPNGLRTSFNETLEFKQEMKGTADFVTEDMRLLQRMFYQFKSLIERKPKSRLPENIKI
jgi:multidrug resistance efflux pump